MAEAKTGDTVRVHYTGKFVEGTVFDSSADHDPLQFTIGKNMVIQGFEEAIIGMKQGESKNIHIPAEKAYGPYHEELVLTVDRDKVPNNMAEVGQQLKLRQKDNHVIIVMVTNVTETNVTLDANHPLAGKDLDFEIRLIEIL